MTQCSTTLALGFSTFVTDVCSRMDSIKMAQYDLMVRWVHQLGAGTSSACGHNDDDSDDALGDGDDASIEE
jgi:hypothetical protein